MVSHKRFLFALALFAALFFGASPTSAADFGSLISPGDLASFHADLEGLSNCTKCHTKGEGLPNANCTSVGCHASIGAAQTIKKGLHGAVADKQCVECHKDHKGKSYRGTEGDLKSFDHSRTGYNLTGKHLITGCEKCHTAKTRKGITSYSGLDTACYSCHKKDDAHKGALKEKCDQCHITQNWKTTKFDHNQVWKLDGKHAKVECKKCHTEKGVYKVEAKEQCITCHKKDDKHKGQLGVKCESCHQATGWKDIQFDHSKTKYPLQGKHAQVQCEKCHLEKAKGVFKLAKYDTCDAPGCHDKGKFGNVHEKQFPGKACESCHVVQGFKPSSFKHEDPAYKGFKLKGKHAKVECEKCHRPDPVTKTVLFRPIDSTACANAGCHDIKARGNIHGPQFKGQACENCHNEESWKPSQFDHNSPAYNGYKLDGKHAKLECAKCHRPDPATQTVLFKPIDSTACANAGCHDIKARGNIHGAQFAGRKCDQCHTTQNWKPSSFEHNAPAYAGYKLFGKHAGVKCEKCHKAAEEGAPVLFRPIDTKSCSNAGCHKDPHAGQFKERACDQCHTPADWKKLTFNHITMSRFPLEGKHTATQCEKCHVGKLWKPLRSECIDCHKKEDDKAHKGKMGPKCEQCHTAVSWEPKSFFHEVTGFALQGAHTQIACANCHKVKGLFTGLGPDCVKCHTDPHYNQFGQVGCDRCHTAKNWYPEKFRHTETGFRLEGGHRVAACESCHPARNYRNTTPFCYNCHSTDFANAVAGTSAKCGSGIAHESTNTNCTECHKSGAFTWCGAAYGHTTMTFTGKHAQIANCDTCHGNTGGAQAGLFWAGTALESQCFNCHTNNPAGMNSSFTYQSAHTGANPCPTDCALCHTTSTFGGVNLPAGLTCD